MSWEKLNVDDYGQVATLTCLDSETGLAADISSYTTLQMILTAPSGANATKTAAFSTDGSDGIIAYTVQDGDIDEEGHWKVQARIAKTGVQITSSPLEFYVEARLD